VGDQGLRSGLLVRDPPVQIPAPYYADRQRPYVAPCGSLPQGELKEKYSEKVEEMEKDQEMKKVEKEEIVETEKELEKKTKTSSSRLECGLRSSN